MDYFNNAGIEFDKAYLISENELEKILADGKVLKEQDTLISGFIRLIELQNKYLIQESSTKSEMIIRFFETEQAAAKLFYDRLDVYENMWNGCGCKIDYYK